MMIARLRGKPTPLRKYRPDFPAKLEAVLMKSLASDPDDRYNTAQDYGMALIDATEEVDVARLRRMLG